MPHAQIHHLTKFGEDSIQNKEVVSKNVNVDRRTHRHTDRQTDDRHLAWVYHKHPWPYGQWVLKTYYIRASCALVECSAGRYKHLIAR